MARRGWTATSWLVAIVGLAGAARFTAIDFGLPHTEARPDERVIIDVALSFLRGNFSPHFFDYPWLYMWAITGLYLAYYALSGAFASVADFAASWPTDWEPFFFLSRLLSAAMGTASVLVIFSIGRRLWDAPTGLVAAFFLALAFLHVQSSHFGTTDVTMIFLVMASIALLIDAHLTARPTRFALAGLVGGLAAATKYNAVLLFVPLAASLTLHVVDSPGRRLRAAMDRRVPLFAGPFLLAFAVGVPFVLFDTEAFWAAMGELWRSIQSGTTAVTIENGWRHHAEYSLRYGVGLPLLLAGGAGAVLLAVREPRVAFLLLAFPVAYFALVGSLGYLFFRYVLPIVPFIVLMAARGVTWTAGTIGGEKRARTIAIATALSGALVAPSAWSTYQFNRVLAQTDSRVVLADWFGSHVPPGSSVLQSGSPFGYAQFDRKLDYEQWLWDRGRRTFLVNGRRPTPELRPEWIVVQESPLPSQTQSIVTEFLAEPYEEIWRLHAVALDKPRVYDRQDAFFVPVSGFDGVVRPGPNFTVYRRIAPRPSD